MPKLVKFLLVNAAIGGLVGVALVIGIIATDLGHIGSLISKSTDPLPPLFLLCIGFASTFGAACAGSAVMLLPGTED